MVASLVAGGFAGVSAWTLAIPWDNVKSLLQADAMERRFSSNVECIKYLYKSKGFKGFFAISKF